MADCLAVLSTWFLLRLAVSFFKSFFTGGKEFILEGAPIARPTSQVDMHGVMGLWDHNVTHTQWMEVSLFHQTSKFSDST